jgi:hypothetical protein
MPQNFSGVFLGAITMNSKQVIEALNNGGYIVTECPKFGGKRLIRHEGDKGRKLSGITYWAVWSAAKLTTTTDGKEISTK